jgi:hypothetical protein
MQSLDGLCNCKVRHVAAGYLSVTASLGLYLLFLSKVHLGGEGTRLRREVKKFKCNITSKTQDFVKNDRKIEQKT